jgi:hypothetical protein
MEKEEIIILYTDDAAASLKTVTGWVSRNGLFFGSDERTARYNGSTHSKCECGKLKPRRYSRCEYCRIKHSNEMYGRYAFEEWDMKSPVCLYDGDEYFWDVDDIENYLEENGMSPSDLKLVICSPNYATEIDESLWEDDLPENSEGELPKDLSIKISELNEFIRKMEPLSWGPSNIRTEYKRN